MQCRLTKETLQIDVGRSLRDYAASVDLRTVEVLLANIDGPTEVILNLSFAEWIDPIPLLALGATLKVASDAGVHVRCELGRLASASSEHRRHLNFLARQGFIWMLADFAEIRWNDTTVLPEGLVDLIDEFSFFPEAPKFWNADCISADIIELPGEIESALSLAKLTKIVEDLVEEGSERLLNVAFGGDPIVRDRLFQKMWRVLFELLSNVADHAASGITFRRERIKPYVGVYARLRAGRPTNAAELKIWRDCWISERADKGS